ncbi:glutathione peroxidase [Pontibacter beigongshangensis]|uniref:glutathione peroxidase n=1 Tax=Pontibacter beigongshangensis TaxID=2574733 RepID=UPI00164FF7A7|nr:glutathione peroxidase [Pontibacter beigongshangensis]
MRKKLFSIVWLAIAFFGVACTPSTKSPDKKQDMEATAQTEAQKQDGFYGFTMTTLDGKEVDFSEYKGKKVMLVNTASECGYTKQYADLQQLHEQHGEDVVILGFPANNFGGQEPGSNEEIASFCEKNYGVNFRMFEKISVVGEDQHPLYAWLEQNSPGQEKPTWNFCKYLVDENGKIVAFYPSKVKPTDEVVLAAIKK